MAIKSVQKSLRTKTKQPVPIAEVSKPIRKTKTKAATRSVPQKPAQSKAKRGQGKIAGSTGLSQISTASKVSSAKNAPVVVARKTKRKVSSAQEAPSAQPKRPLTSYVCYTGANFSSYKQNHPDATVPDCMRAVAAEWGKMTEADKKPYVKLHDADVKRYEKEKSDLDTQGFFINKEGQDSRTLRVKVKRGRAVVPAVAAAAATDDEDEEDEN